MPFGILIEKGWTDGQTNACERKYHRVLEYVKKNVTKHTAPASHSISSP